MTDQLDKITMVKQMEEDKKIFIRILARGIFCWTVFADDGFRDCGESDTMADMYVAIYDSLSEADLIH